MGSLGSLINFYDRDLEPALEAMKDSGCSAVELGCGGFITKRHFNPQELLEDEKVVTFAGCPGTSDNDLNPSWITCPWPDYFTEALTW